MKKNIILPKDRTDWVRLKNMKDEDIDFSDIPPLTDDFFKNARVHTWEPKTAISVRLDSDLLKWFKGQGKGYQTKINTILRQYAAAHGMGKARHASR